jgi:putative transposase
LALIVARQLRHEDGLAVLADLFIARGPPANIRSDNGCGVEDVAQQQLITTTVQKWLGQIGVTTRYIAPGSPWDVRGPANDLGDRSPEDGL